MIIREWRASSRMVMIWNVVKPRLTSSSVIARWSRLRMPEKLPDMYRILYLCRFGLRLSISMKVCWGATRTLTDLAAVEEAVSLGAERVEGEVACSFKI